MTPAEVEKELNEVSAADWFPLGEKLGIKPAKLREIEKDHPMDVRRCKAEVLDWWHRNEPEISRQKLALALKEMGGYTKLVQRLERSGTYALGMLLDYSQLYRKESSLMQEHTEKQPLIASILKANTYSQLVSM